MDATPDDLELRDPWLLAAWPGMGAVALGAATYLLEHLDFTRLEELPPSAWFDVTQVAIEEGLVKSGGMPKSTWYGWKNPDPGGSDLLLFFGEAQPSTHGYAFCRDLVAQAMTWGATRAFTFAAMATPSHPSADARCFGVATRRELLEQLEDEDVEILTEGEISGLNGVLLAAAAERDLPAVCLLGEFPYFASGIKNPKASAAVLRVFTRMACIEIPLAELDAEAESVERGLTQLLERLQRATRTGPPSDGEPGEMPFVLPDDEDDDDDDLGESDDEGPRLSRADRLRLERLFAAATQDRQEALKLKAELDRLGVFKDYEDRFLDLFKQGG